MNFKGGVPLLMRGSNGAVPPHCPRNLRFLRPRPRALLGTKFERESERWPKYMQQSRQRWKYKKFSKNRLSALSVNMIIIIIIIINVA